VTGGKKEIYRDVRFFHGAIQLLSVGHFSGIFGTTRMWYQLSMWGIKVEIKLEFTLSGATMAIESLFLLSDHLCLYFNVHFQVNLG